MIFKRTMTFWLCSSISNCKILIYYKASKLLQIFCRTFLCFLRHITTLLYSMQCVRTKHKTLFHVHFVLCDYLYIIACKSKKSSMKVIPCRDWFVECNKSIFLKILNKTSFVLKYFAFDELRTLKTCIVIFNLILM